MIDVSFYKSDIPTNSVKALWWIQITHSLASKYHMGKKHSSSLPGCMTQQPQTRQASY